MTEQIANGYADEDLKQIVEEIEGYEDDKVSARAEAAGKCGAINKKIKNTKKHARSLNIPTVALNVLLKTRKLERKLKDTVAEVPEEFTEVFEDMTELLGEFSDTPLGGAAIQAAKEHREASEEKQQAEQEEGAAYLEEMTAG